MPVSVMCDTASVVNAALRESIQSSSSSTANSTRINCNSTNNSVIGSGHISDSNCKNNNENDKTDSENIQNKLVASTKRILFSKIEYEEVNNYNQTVLDGLKSKYIILKPTGSTNLKINQTHSNSSTSTATGHDSNYLKNHSNNSNERETKTQNSSSSTQNPNSSEHKNQLHQAKRVLFPKENVQVGWKNSNYKWQVGSGMINVGNTCYLNSTLQALFHVPAMANWLMSDSTHREKCKQENESENGCIICAVSNTLISSQTNQSAIKPYLVYSKLKLICKHLLLGRQEDAHEFLRYLVEAMERSYLSRYRNWKELDQQSKETTPLNQILGGYLKSAVRCLSCGHVSTTFQHFQDLLLDIRKANTIEEALDGYFSRERLEDMGYKCEACKKKVSATKQFTLERAPISLCIQLKRFSVVGMKINKHVAIRTHLDLSPYVSNKNSESLKYKLVSMIMHLGVSQHCGHYTAIGLTDTGSYYQFDDGLVRQMPMQSVLNSNAYIMFYELDESQPLGYSTSKLTSTQVSDNSTHLEQTKENIYHKINGQKIHNNIDSKVYFQTIVLPNNSDSENISPPKSKSTIIGPQPSDKLLNGYRLGTTSSSTSPKQSNGIFTTCNSQNKLVNSKLSNGVGNNNNTESKSSTSFNSSTSSSSSKEQSGIQTPLNNKLTIHFKNANNGMSTSLSPFNIKLQGSNNSIKLQLSDSNKKQTENKVTNIGNSVVKSILPSMPKLECSKTQNYTTSSSSLSKAIVLYSPKKTSNSSLKHFKDMKSNCNADKSLNKSVRNLSETKSIKRLVPYESDEDESSSDEENSRKNYVKVLKVKTLKDGNRNKNNVCNNEIYIDSSSSSSSPSSSPKDISKASPSLPIVKSASGVRKVSSVNDSRKTTILPSITATTTSTITTTSTEKKNPFSSGTSTSNFYSSLNNSSSDKGSGKDKSNKKYENGYSENNNVVDQLLKFSHQGYGAPVLSWNGQNSEMEREIVEETRLERKRELKDDEENEMDRGRQKKIKTNNTSNSRDNCGYNPFQEYQNNQQQQRRWNNNKNSNNSSNTNSNSVSSNRYQNSNNINNSNNSKVYNRHINQNNPFYRNHNHNHYRNRNHRFHNQKPSQHRNKFHHRRSS